MCADRLFRLKQLFQLGLLAELAERAERLEEMEESEEEVSSHRTQFCLNTDATFVVPKGLSLS